MNKYKKQLPTASEYNYLNEKVGWGTRNVEIVEKALNNTLFGITVFDDDKVIGMARIIGDETIFLYIQDVIVIPEYQGKGIGKEIMNLLLEKINEYKKINSNIRVYLGAAIGKEEFYKKFGFITRKDANLGEGMILKINNNLEC